MKYLSLACLFLGAALVLRAQTNSASSTVTNSAPVPRTNAPTEVRPTEIQSLSGQFFLRSNIYVYRGDVHVDDPRMKLTCDLLTIEAPKLPPPAKFNRATAETNVVIDWVDDKGTNHATSDKAVYTYVITNPVPAGEAPHLETNAVVVLTGNPVVTNSQGVFKGDPINWDRINDVITSPNLVNMTINSTQTNNSDLFETPAPKPRGKTNAPPK